jgi:hypothetical protein
MVTEHGAQGRVSGKSVCDGCRLILSAAVWGVKLWDGSQGTPLPIFRKDVNLGRLRTRKMQEVDWKGDAVFAFVDDSLRIETEGRATLQGSIDLLFCQWVLKCTVRMSGRAIRSARGMIRMIRRQAVRLSDKSCRVYRAELKRDLYWGDFGVGLGRVRARVFDIG